ncbi:MAG: 4-hydroxy-tetrahydrodipicolinate synthase, partial [Reyranella sp.]|nr:4-hydroxy-tetrahydrodipicolinate synthase [Reyranella sp.]
RRLIERGIAALVPCGTTGESPLLTAEEHHHVVAATVTAAAGRVPVIAGACSNNTQTAAELARSAERAGADALLCVTPFYLKPSQAGMMMHFRAIHDAVGIPIILYDVPSRTAVALSDVTVRRLAELPRIIGLKDATGEIPRVARLRRRLGPDFLLLSGDDASQAAFRSAGGDGCISVTANVAPALCAALHHAADERLDADVQSYSQILAPLHAALFLEANPIPLKRALSRLGLMGDSLRLPLTPLSADADRTLGKVLAEVMPHEETEARRFAAHHVPHAA